METSKMLFLAGVIYANTGLILVGVHAPFLGLVSTVTALALFGAAYTHLE